MFGDSGWINAVSGRGRTVEQWHHPGKTLERVDLGGPAFYHGPVMPDSQSSLEQAICHYHILKKLGDGRIGVSER